MDQQTQRDRLDVARFLRKRPRVIGRTAALVLLLCLACRPPAPQTPVQTYLGFVHDLHEGDAAAAYALLSKPTQQALQSRADAVAKASGGSVKPDPVTLVFQGPPPTPPSEVKLVQQSGGQAIVQVTGPQGSEQVHLVQEAGSWRIDLTPTLR